MSNLNKILKEMRVSKLILVMPLLYSLVLFLVTKKLIGDLFLVSFICAVSLLLVFHLKNETNNFDKLSLIFNIIFYPTSALYLFFELNFLWMLMLVNLILLVRSFLKDSSSSKWLHFLITFPISFLQFL